MTIVLIVDDDRDIVDFLSVFLRDEGYEVITANNGEEGLAYLETKRPALVLCDLMMPVLNGREMCLRMQANKRYRSIPFVVMSAVSSVVNSDESPYTAVMNKPFDLSDVLKIIAQLVTASSPNSECGSLPGPPS